MDSAQRVGLLRELLGRVQRNRRVAAGPVAAESVAAESIVAESVVAESVVAEPVVARPVVAGPQHQAPSADRAWSSLPAPPSDALAPPTPRTEVPHRRPSQRDEVVAAVVSTDIASEEDAPVVTLAAAGQGLSGASADSPDRATSGELVPSVPSQAPPTSSDGGLTTIDHATEVNSDTLEVELENSEFVHNQQMLEPASRPPSIEFQSVPDSAVIDSSLPSASVQDAVYQSIEPISEPIPSAASSHVELMLETTLKTQRVDERSTERSAESMQPQAVELQTPQPPTASPQLEVRAIAPRSLMPPRLDGSAVGDFIGAVETIRLPTAFGAVLAASLDLVLDD